MACIDDITESSRMHEELEARATFDTLTACYNRASIMVALEGALSDTRGAEVGTAAIFVDLDHFKQINDRLGHASGDRLLSPRSPTDSAERSAATTPSADSVVTSSSSCAPASADQRRR